MEKYNVILKSGDENMDLTKTGYVLFKGAVRETL